MASALSDLAFASKQYWGYPADWMNEWKSSLTISSEAIQTHLAFVAREAGVPIGFYLLEHDPAEAVLEHLWIQPSQIRKGIGRLLFEHAVAEARRHKFSAIVIEADPHAEGFYNLMGAQKVRCNISTVLGVRRELPVMRYVL